MSTDGLEPSGGLAVPQIGNLRYTILHRHGRATGHQRPCAGRVSYRFMLTSMIDCVNFETVHHMGGSRCGAEVVPTADKEEISMPVLKIALPSGSLQESTLNLFANAGYRILANHRSYIPSIDDPDLEGLFLRAQEIAHYVEGGVLDVGRTGKDWILENEADVVEVAELPYSKSTARPARWVIAVPEESPVRTVNDLQGKRIATELVNVTRKYLEEQGVLAEVEFSWGSTEAKVRTAGARARADDGGAYEPGLVDAIVELTETGSSIRANKLRIVEDLLETTPRLIANRSAWDDPWKREKAQNIATLLVGAFQAEDKVGLKMNVRRRDLDAVVGLLPALNNPTISNLLDGDWVAVEVVVDERVVRDTVPLLKNKGAEGIIEYPLNKVIY